MSKVDIPYNMRPCPLCGSVAYLHSFMAGRDLTVYKVRCSDFSACGCSSGDFERPLCAVDRWNSREPFGFSGT